MKNLMREIIFGINAKASAVLVVGILIFVGLGCFGGGRSSSSKPVPPEYFGVWTGQDGSMITIRGDGKGDYKSGGTTVDGGTVEIDDAKKELSITFFGIGPTKKIDSPPSGDEMKLDGVIYKRSGGSGSSPTSTTSKSPATDASPVTKSSPAFKSNENADASKGEMPSDGELQEMVKESLLDFNDAIKQEDFTDFHGKISKAWQKQTTPETFKQSFGKFIEEKIDIGGIGALEPDFSPTPDITKTQGVNILEAIGRYETYPNPTRFELKYIPDGKNWKLIGIRVDTRR